MDFKINNFTIREFNNDVNNSGNLHSKYIEWSSYRKKINEFIYKSINETNNIIVIGAGECNDVDLHFLINTFNNVTLSDVDTDSIEAGIARQKLSKDEINKITIVQEDYTGLSKIDFFDNLSKLATDKVSHKDIVAYIKEAINNVKTDGILIHHRNKYDAVLVCPTYTQLAYTQMEVLLKILYQYNTYPIDDLNTILATMHHQMTEIIINYNSLIISLANDMGRLFVLVDIAEITDIPIIKSLAENIENKEYIDKFLIDNSLDFGKIGDADLKRNMQLIDESYTIWPFDEYKQYLICLISGKATNI